MFSQSMSRIYYFHITPNFTFLLGKAEFLNCPLILYRRLRPHEAHLSTVALSNVESSRTIGQILHDMNDMKDLKWIKDTPSECVLSNSKPLVATSNLSVETQEEVHGWHPSIIYPLPILFFYSHSGVTKNSFSLMKHTRGTLANFVSSVNCVFC